ncbi:hypothetical protein U9M48_027461 [Paspalum notatum var. saurae]|uniref:RING-type E3 ubiquitin transferase n=1 Tax=Paspalum notatum var. saurae TaxID=547442 RepID=A0AAQ3TV77_PASNO
MSVPLPPTPGIIFPPIPWYPLPPSPPLPNPPKSPAGAIAGISIAIGIILFIVSCVCSLVRGQRQSQASASATAVAIFIQPQPTASSGQPPHRGEQQQRGGASSSTSALPSFTYNMSMRHNATSGGGGEEAPTCSVCLGVFQVGETVRLLPVCLHLFHVECIDPWLDAHSTCPICRSGTGLSTTDGGLLPPV